MAKPGPARERFANPFGVTASVWYGVLGPPILWASRIGSGYVLVPYACGTGSMLLLHLVSLVALTGTAVAGVLAWRNRRVAGREGDELAAGNDPVHRFMARIGLLSSAFFFLVIVAESLANFFVHPCQQGMALL